MLLSLIIFLYLQFRFIMDSCSLHVTYNSRGAWNGMVHDEFSCATSVNATKHKMSWGYLEIVMNELRRFKHSADLFANSSHIIEFSCYLSSIGNNPTNPLALRNCYIKNLICFQFKIATSFKISAKND